MREAKVRERDLKMLQCGPWRWRTGALSQGMQAASRSWKGQETDSPLEPPEGTQPWWHIDLKTSNFQDYKIIHWHYFKPLSLCYSNRRKLIQPQVCCSLRYKVLPNDLLIDASHSGNTAASHMSSKSLRREMNHRWQSFIVLWGVTDVGGKVTQDLSCLLHTSRGNTEL